MAGAELLGLGAGMLSNWMANDTNETINRQQMQNQHALLAIQQGFAAEQAEKADERTRALYTDFMTPEARRKQLEEAGLSVGMMYGSGGAGGNMTSGAQAASPSPTSASAIGMHPLGMEAAAILQNIKKTEAETEKIKAETNLKIEELPLVKQQIEKTKHEIKQIDENINKTKEETDKIIEEKLNTAEERNNIREQIKLITAQEKYYDALEKLTQTQNLWEPKKAEAQIQEMKAQARQLNKSAEQIGLQNEITEQTKHLIVEKAVWETWAAYIEANEIKPNEAEKIKTETQALLAGKWTTEERNKFYEKNKWLLGVKFLAESLGTTIGQAANTAIKAAK